MTEHTHPSLKRRKRVDVSKNPRLHVPGKHITDIQAVMQIREAGRAIVEHTVVERPIINKKFIVVVLGMHRSGTSAIAKTLHSLGINMGERFSKANQQNPYGYWEDLDFVEMNAHLLYMAGGRWDDPPYNNKIMAAGLKKTEQILAIIKRKSVDGFAWGFKDPRTCLTICCYIEHFPWPVKYIIVKRKPSLVVKSLQDRGASDRTADYWKRLVRQYDNRIKRFITNDMDVHTMQFEDFTSVKRGPRAVTGLARFLGVDETVLSKNAIVFRKG